MNWTKAKPMQFKVLNDVGKKFRATTEKTGDKIQFRGRPLSMTVFVNALFHWISNLDQQELMAFMEPKVREFEKHMAKEE
jgi:hypothetical protein